MSPYRDNWVKKSQYFVVWRHGVVLEQYVDESFFLNMKSIVVVEPFH